MFAPDIMHKFRGKKAGPSARSGGDGEADGEDKEGGGLIIC